MRRNKVHMMSSRNQMLAFLACAPAGIVLACGGELLHLPDYDAGLSDGGDTESGKTDGGDDGPAATYGVGGFASGLLGAGLVLQNNAGNDLPIAGDGPFTFATTLTAGAAYAVTIKTQPTAPSQTCTVNGGTGTMGSGSVTSVKVTCAVNDYTVGGNVSDLAGTGLILQNNGGDDLTVKANGTFAFGAPTASGATYAVTIKSQPTNPSQNCAVSNPSGTVGGANVTGVSVTCTCTAGRCLVELASGQDYPYAIAVDATSVYWTNWLGGTVVKVPLGGGAAITLASGQNAPTGGIVVDATSVYWANYNNNGSVMKVPLGGGAPITLGSGQLPTGIAVDATSVYWANSGYGTVMKVPLGGGAPTAIVSALVSPTSVAVDATSVYWVSTDGTVIKVPLGGGTRTLLATGAIYPGAIAVDASSVYWAGGGAGTVMKVPLGGGPATTLVSGQGNTFCLAVDATDVYWTDSTNGTVMKVPVGGGAPTTLASGQSAPLGIAVDATSVYWTNRDSLGTVMKVTPK